MRGIISIIIGAIMIIGGLSGKIVLRGTHSGGAAAAIGGVILLIGVARLMRSSNS